MLRRNPVPGETATLGTRVPYVTVGASTVTIGSVVLIVATTPDVVLPPRLMSGTRRSTTSPASQIPSPSPLVPPTESSSRIEAPSMTTGAGDAFTVDRKSVV